MRTFAVLLSMFSIGCSTYQGQLARSEKAFDATEYDRAKVSLVDLEAQESRLDPADRARFEYLRGMTAYRLGERADARHWLALARTRGNLPSAWKARLDEALAELDGVVLDEGYAALLTKK